MSQALFPPIIDSLMRHRLSVPKYVVLSLLSQKELVMRDLSIALGHCAAATTGIIDRLCDGEMVTRSTNKTDRRSVMVSITDAGRKFLATVNQDVK